mgnify:CR=1 FL=1
MRDVAPLDAAGPEDILNGVLQRFNFAPVPTTVPTITHAWAKLRDEHFDLVFVPLNDFWVLKREGALKPGGFALMLFDDQTVPTRQAIGVMETNARIGLLIVLGLLLVMVSCGNSTPPTGVDDPMDGEEPTGPGGPTGPVARSRQTMPDVRRCRTGGPRRRPGPARCTSGR